MFYGYGLDPTIIILIPALLISMYAQGKVQSTFRRFSNVRNQTGLTGAQAARRMLDVNGLQDVQINAIAGSLTDHYDPRNRTLNLSEPVYNVPSVAAVSVACHEAGHALQHARGYVPLTFRNTIVPVVNFASRISWIMIVIGILLLFAGRGGGSPMGGMILDIGIIAFIVVIVFHLVTLPVEFNASRRALQQMESIGLVMQEDMVGSRKVLRAAAFTYVAAALMAIANLLRILAIVGFNRE